MNLFNSNQNKNIIKSIINDDLYKENKINIGNNHDVIINETMQFVQSQVSKTTPKGMTNDEYLYLMNKKVYDIAFPIIDEIVKNQKKNKINNEYKVNNENKIINENKVNNKNIEYYENSKKGNNKELNETIFDPLLLRNFETPTIMDYPKANDMKKSSTHIESNFKSLEEQRATLTPKIKPVDFKLSVDEKNNTMEKYNELISSISNFDNSQKNINQNIENKMIVSDDVSSFTPIDLLKNNSNNLKDPSTAFNRNDIKILNNDNDINNEYGIENFVNFSENNNNNYEKIGHNNNNFPKEFMNFNNDNLGQNGNGVNKLEFSNVNQNNNMILEPVLKIVEKKKILIVNSKQRDLALWPNQTQFQIKFAPSGNNYIYKSYYDEHNTLIIREKNINYGEFSEADAYGTLDDITSVNVTIVNVPVITNINDNVFAQQYLLLTIPELRGPYISLNTFLRNSFAKLEIDYSSNLNFNGLREFSNFTKLTKSNDEEFFKYNPVTLGKLNTMTINLQNQDGVLYNFGIDKLFVKNISEGSLINNGYCGKQFNSTRITIQNTNAEYAKYCKLYSNYGDCSVLNSHPVQIYDLLYFYNTMPSIEQIVYLEDYIKISKITKDVNKGITLVASYKLVDENGKSKNINVNFNYIIPETNFKQFYIIIFDKSANEIYYLKIKSINKASIILKYLNLPNFNNYNNLKIGISKGNPRGNVEAEPINPYYRSLFNITGYNVTNTNVNDNLWEIEINYPYENLPNYLKEPEFYNAGDIFFIQSKLQITYTFIIKFNEKDNSIIDSLLNGTPGR